MFGVWLYRRVPPSLPALQRHSQPDFLAWKVPATMRVSAVFDMSEVERASALIGDIYDAALDPALWPDVFDGISAYLGTAIASLTSHDNFRQSAEFHFISTRDRHYQKLYFDSYFRINPIFPTVIFNDIEKTLSMPDVIPHAELCKSKFGREWLAPQGLIDGAISIMEK